MGTNKDALLHGIHDTEALLHQCSRENKELKAIVRVLKAECRDLREERDDLERLASLQFRQLVMTRGGHVKIQEPEEEVW